MDQAISGVKAVVGRLTAYATMEIEDSTVQLKLISIPEKISDVNSIYLVKSVYLILKKFADLNGVGEAIHVKIKGKNYSFRISGFV